MRELIEIIQPKDNLIQKLYEENVFMHKELSKQNKLVQKAEKFEEERVVLLKNNEKLKKQCNDLNEKVTDIKVELTFKHENEIIRLSNKYKKEIKRLRKQLQKFEMIFETIKETIKFFISWICKKFSVQSEDEIMHKFKMDTGRTFNFDKQLNVKQVEKENELEM